MFKTARVAARITVWRERAEKKDLAATWIDVNFDSGMVPH
jgi:hypothetical protein